MTSSPAWRRGGYSESSAPRATRRTWPTGSRGLCTNVVPLTEWSALDRPSEAAAIAAYWRLGSRLATPHLPQGAPTSPALANLAAFSLDRRMSGLAEKLGARYTRYADDLVLSGSPGLAGRSARLTQTVAEIARDEAFACTRRFAQIDAD